MIIIFGVLALLVVFSGGGGFVFPLRDRKKYYLPKIFGGDVWLSSWNFGAPRNGHGHAGIDLVPRTTPQTTKDLDKHEILAYGSGVVQNSGYNATYGYIIEIKHNNALKTRYVHLSKSFVKNGQNVSAGQIIGLMGYLGSSPNNISGSHLHFEIYENGKAKDPVPFLKKILQ